MTPFVTDLSDRPVAASQDSLIDQVWNCLPCVNRVESRAAPGAASRTRWRGHGAARVQVESTPDTRRFVELGQFWPGDASSPVTIRNVYLWQRDGASLRLSHERFGRDAPVFLLRLVRVDDATLEGGEPHQCALDQYRATLCLTADGFRLDWVVTGPHKDERLSQRYYVRIPPVSGAAVLHRGRRPSQ